MDRSTGPALRCAALLVLTSCTVDARAPFSAGNGLHLDEQSGELSVDSTRVPDVSTCADGHLLTKAGSTWSCVPAPDPDIPPATNGGLVGDASGLRVDTTKVPLLTTCAEGELVARSGGGWSCVPEVVLPAPLVAGPGVALADGTISADSSKVPVLSACAAGQLVSRTSVGWACVAAPVVPSPIGPMSLAAGDCVSVRHGLGSTGVVPSIFRRAVNAARWVPDVLGYQALGIELIALGDKVAQTTGGLGGSVVANAQDFSTSTAWYGEVGATFTVDLGARYSLDRLEPHLTTPGAPDQTSDVEMQVSLDGVNFLSLARKQVACGQVTASFSPQGAEARHVRFIGHAARNCPENTTGSRVTLAQLTVVVGTPATAYRIIDADTLELCNRFETRMEWIVLPYALPPAP